MNFVKGHNERRVKILRDWKNERKIIKQIKAEEEFRSSNLHLRLRMEHEGRGQAVRQDGRVTS